PIGIDDPRAQRPFSGSHDHSERADHPHQDRAQNQTPDAGLGSRLQANAHYWRRLEPRCRLRVRPISNRDRHLDYAPLMWRHRAALVLKLLHQADDHDRIFDQRNLAQEAAWNPEFLVRLDVIDLYFRPGGFAEKPLIVLDIDNGGIKRKRARAQMVEGRRNG